MDPAELHGQRGQLPQEVPWPGKCVGNVWENPPFFMVHILIGGDWNIGLVWDNDG